MARARKITKLTPEQESLIPVLIEKWRAIGLSTERVVPEEARDAIRELYRAAGRKEPGIILMAQSPMQALLMRGVILLLLNGGQLRGQLGGQLWGQLRSQLGDQLRDQLWDQLWGQLWGQLRGQLGGQLRSQLWGQLGGQLLQAVWTIGGWDGFWLVLFETGREIGVRYTNDQHFDAYIQYASKCGVAFCYDQVVFVCDRPSRASFDQARRLHSDSARALEWPDGYGIYAWHGYRLPPSHEYLIAKRDPITLDVVLAEQNAELRRIMFEIGLERDPELLTSKAKVVSADELHGQPRRLLSVKLGRETVRVLEVINGTVEPDGTRRRFHLGAMPGRTPHECVAASFGRPAEKYHEAIGT